MIRFFASHPTASNLLMVFFLVIGLVTLPDIRRETLPDFTPQQLEIRVVYPGATADEVENAVCQRIEDAVDDVSFIDEVYSLAQEGLALVTITMQENGNFESFFQNIQNEVNAINDLPSQAQQPLIKQLGITDLVISLAITGDMSTTDLRLYGEQIKKRLCQLEEVSQVTILGFSEQEIRIEVEHHTLMQYGLSMTDITNTVAGQSVDMPLGTIKTRERDILLRFSDRRYREREFADLVVLGTARGAEIKLGDIARINTRFIKEEDKIIFGNFDDENGKIVFNGKRACVLQITKTKTEDALTIVDAVKKFIDQQRNIAPPGVEFTFTQDVSSIVRDRLNLLLKNGWQGLILVFLIMWMFFDLRFSFWVAMGLPVSFLGTLSFFLYLDYSLNMITMLGLLLALGLLMDDAIVLSENVATHLQQGKSALQAAIQGVNEVKIGVLSSFITTICVFIPLCFIAGNMGKILKVMPVVLILVLIISIIEAFLILPHHLAHSMRGVDIRRKNRWRQAVDYVMEKLRAATGRIVNWAVRWNYLVLGITMMMLLISIAMLIGGILKFQAFPDLEGDVINAQLILPQGTPLHRTEQAAQQLVNGLRQVEQHFSKWQPDGKRLITNIMVQFSFNPGVREQGAHLLSIYADLLSAEIRHGRINDILNLWRLKTGTIDDAIVIDFAQPALPVAGLPIEMRIFGQNLEQVHKASQDIKHWLSSFPGVLDLYDDLLLGKPEVKIKLREGATGLGLNAHMVASQLRSSFYGDTASEIHTGTQAYEVNIRFPQASKNSLGDLEYFYVSTPQGQHVPLTAVATLEYVRGYARIARVDGQRVSTIQGKVDTQRANTEEILRKFNTQYREQFKKRHPQIAVELNGEFKQTRITEQSLYKTMGLGILGIFILLSFQFKSYIKPIIVMIAIPCSFIGIVWGHLFMGINLTLPSLLGLASLSGVVVNDSILLVEFVQFNEKKGKTIIEAATLASCERFRAVIMTSLTTIGGLIPLLLEKSFQARILIPIATSIVFGLVASTILVLIVLPCLYAALSDFTANSYHRTSEYELGERNE